MIDNVFPFPALSQRSQSEIALSNEQSERSDANARRVFDANVKKRPLIKKPSEQIKIATNLWRILEELENGCPSISKRQVMHAAGQGKGTDSTKRLPYFAINPGLPGEEIKKRSELLIQHIDRYLTIIDAASRLSETDRWLLTKRLIEGTSYSPSLNDVDIAGEDLIFESWDNIVTAIQKIAWEVSNKHDLPRFFERARALGVEEHSGGLRQRMRYSAKQIDLRSTPLPALISDEELPPRPTVYLGAIRVCDDIPCTIRLRVGYGDGEKEGELRKRLIEAGVEYESVKGAATPVLHADVELLPLGRQDIITPVLRLRPMTYIRSAQEFAEFLPLGGNKWKRGEDLGAFDGPIEPAENSVENSGKDSQVAAFDHASESFVDCQIKAEFEPDDLQPPYEGSLHCGTAVGRAWVGRFDDWAKTALGSKPFTRRAEYLFERYCYGTADEMVEIGIKDTSRPAFTLSLGNTMAALLERSIFDAPEAARLDRLLDKAAGVLVEELESKIEEARTRRRERLDELRRE